MLQKTLKILDRIAIILFNLGLLVIAIWITVIPIARSKSFYLFEYEKNDTVAITGYTMEQLEIITDRIIDYLFDEVDDMQVMFGDEVVFSNQALIHMADVKDLFIHGQQLAWIVFILWIMIGVFLGLRFSKIRMILFKYSFIAILMIVGIVGMIGIFALIDFDQMFTLFHHIIFPDPIQFRDAFFGAVSNYPEAPGVSNLMLIMILSIELFMDIAAIIIASVIVIFVVWMILNYTISIRYIKKLKEMEYETH